MKKGKMMHMITWGIAMLGAADLGFIGVGGLMGQNWNLINLVLRPWPVIELSFYILIGLSAIWEIATHKKTCRMCNPDVGHVAQGQ